jgi:hypothetical protein
MLQQALFLAVEVRLGPVPKMRLTLAVPYVAISAKSPLTILGEALSPSMRRANVSDVLVICRAFVPDDLCASIQHTTETDFKDFSSRQTTIFFGIEIASISRSSNTIGRSAGQRFDSH